MRSEFTRSPSRERIAGSKVIDASTAARTTEMAPMARLRKIVVGMSSMPTSASTTVSPLKKTALFAVAPDAAIASILSRPWARSSR
jgi:hypothetical protein